jgi:DNA-binding PadR family transcriptional regulator
MLTRQEERILLIVHSLGQKAYLVSIREELKKITGNYLDLGTIYVPLRRLHQRGLLDAHLGKPTALRGGKSVKYYRLNERGYRILSAQKETQEKLWKNFTNPYLELKKNR